MGRRTQTKRASSIPLQYSPIEGLEEAIYKIDEEDTEAVETTTEEEQDENLKCEESKDSTESSKNSTADASIEDKLSITQMYLKRLFYDIV